MLMFFEKSTHEERLSQPLQTNNKQFKIAVTFLTGYNGIFNVTNKTLVQKSNTDKDGYIQIAIPSGAYEIKSLNNEIKMIIIEEERYTEPIYPFTVKPNFSTHGSIIEISNNYIRTR